MTLLFYHLNNNYSLTQAIAIFDMIDSDNCKIVVPHLGLYEIYYFIVNGFCFIYNKVHTANDTPLKQYH